MKSLFLTLSLLAAVHLVNSAEAPPHAPAIDFRVISKGDLSGSYQAFPDACRLQDGSILCVFYAGYTHVSLPREDFPKGGRVCSVRSTDEGRHWSAPRILLDSPLDDRDPHIAQLSDGTLLCTFFTYQPRPNQETLCETALVRSRDNGETWDEKPQVLASGWPSSAPVRQLPNGLCLLGVYREESGSAYGGVLRSTDGGRTWSSPIPIGQGSGVRLDAETDLVRLTNGVLYAALRGDKVPMHFATSADDGLTWSAVRSLGFPGHCPHFTRLSSGPILLVHRLPKTALHVSWDDAKTWKGPFPIDSTTGAYPSTVELKDGSVLVVYYEEGPGSAIRARRFHLQAEGIQFDPL